MTSPNPAERPTIEALLDEYGQAERLFERASHDVAIREALERRRKAREAIIASVRELKDEDDCKRAA